MIPNPDVYTLEPSGVERLGDVPAHWEVMRLRNVAEMRVSNIDKHTKPDEQPVRLCNYLDVYKNDRIRSSMAFMRATATGDEIERFRLQAADVLITKDSETWSDIGVPALVEDAAVDLVSGYHLALLRPLPDRVKGGYLFRAFQSPAVAYQFHVEANGVTRYGLSHSAIKSIWIPVPPLPEQAAIVRFLDHADRRIRRYIRSKQKLIKLLEEQKQAIMHRAVTRGLDPDVRLKPSGVEWLGDVPEHWEVRRLKSLLAVPITDGPHMTPVFEAAGVPFLSVDGIQDGELIFDGCRHVSQAAHADFTRKTAPRRDDILLTKAASIGKVARVKVDFEFSVWSPLALIRVDQRVAYPGFVEHSLKDTGAQTQVQALCTISTQKNLSMDDIPRIALPVPPIDEQLSIAGMADELTAKASRGQAQLRHEIDLMREYRTRLIADVVTGKLDVREVAARLSDEAEEPEPLDETDALTDANDATANDLHAALEEVEV